MSIMLSSNKVYKTLSLVGVPVFYLKPRELKNLPYIIYFETGSRNILADNKIYIKGNSYAIELYTRYKDFKLAERLESKLDEGGIIWSGGTTVFLPEPLDAFMTPYYI